jgi:hypothetical protein
MYFVFSAVFCQCAGYLRKILPMIFVITGLQLPGGKPLHPPGHCGKVGSWGTWAVS